MTVDELLAEALKHKEQSWFIQALEIADRTDLTIKLHLKVNDDLFVQVYFSERSGRFSLTLVGLSGRLYGRDREYNRWHLHPFENPNEHQPTPEGISPRPISQFMSEVEAILVENDLL